MRLVRRHWCPVTLARAQPVLDAIKALAGTAARDGSAETAAGLPLGRLPDHRRLHRPHCGLPGRKTRGGPVTSIDMMTRREGVTHDDCLPW